MLGLTPKRGWWEASGLTDGACWEFPNITPDKCCCADPGFDEGKWGFVPNWDCEVTDIVAGECDWEIVDFGIGRSGFEGIDISTFSMGERSFRVLGVGKRGWEEVVTELPTGDAFETRLPPAIGNNGAMVDLVSVLGVEMFVDWFAPSRCDTGIGRSAWWPAVVIELTDVLTACPMAICNNGAEVSVCSLLGNTIFTDRLVPAGFDTGFGKSGLDWKPAVFDALPKDGSTDETDSSGTDACLLSRLVTVVFIGRFMETVCEFGFGKSGAEHLGCLLAGKFSSPAVKFPLSMLYVYKKFKHVKLCQLSLEKYGQCAHRVTALAFVSFIQIFRFLFGVKLW